MSFINKKIYLPMVSQLGIQIPKPKDLTELMASNSVEARALRVMYWLSVNAYTGYILTITKLGREDILNCGTGFESQELVSRKQAEQFIGLTCSILPTLVRVMGETLEPVSVGALGILRTTISDNLTTATLRNRALSVVYKDPLATKIFEANRDTFDGHLTVQDLLRQK